MHGMRENAIVVLLLGLIVVLAYGDVVFLGYTLSPALNTEGVLNGLSYGYNGRFPYLYTVVDPLATGGQNWPIYYLISKTLLSGRLPLWNPYQGTGAPLAADTTWSTYFPIDLLYFIPNQFWDFVWLPKLWIAGVLCYLLLKKLGLRMIPAFGGGVAYSLSGAFSFYPFMPWTDVAVMTPALLLAAKTCFDDPFSGKSLALGGGVLAISLLGAHMEALVIQFLYVTVFVVFEVVTRRSNRLRGFATWAAVVLLGFGIAAFFLLPVFEYLREANLGHPAGWGLSSFLTDSSSPLTFWLTLFVPYFYGYLRTYPYLGLRQIFFWDISPGYIGTTVFFLSVFGVFCIRSMVKREGSKYHLFFLIGALLVLMKMFGVPPVNWMGYLPVLTYVIYTRFGGSALAMSFAGACAYGLENVAEHKRRSLVLAVLIVLVSLGIPALATIPFLGSPSNKTIPAIPFLSSLSNPFFPLSLATLTLSTLFLALSSIAVSKRGVAAEAVLVSLIALELVSYISRGLLVQYEAVSVGILTVAGIFSVILSRKRPGSPGVRSTGRPSMLTFLRTALCRKRLLVMIIAGALVLQFMVAGASPWGLANRYDPFTPAPYIHYLQSYVGYQRVYSLDGVFFPPVAGVFAIQNLGEFSSLMPSSFRTFSLTNLDAGAAASTFVGNAWARDESISVVSEIQRNMPFYSLLGVKYFVTSHTELNVVPMVYHDQNVTIYENFRVFPRTFLLNNVIEVKNQEEAVLKTRELGWNTSNTLVIEGPLSTPSYEIGSHQPRTSMGNANITQYSPGEVTVRVEADSPSFLVLTDTYYPGWRAYVDGKPDTIYRAYGLVRAIFVNAGIHEVLFRYEPDSFKMGAIISSASTFVIIGLLLRSFLVKRLHRLVTSGQRS